MSVSKHESERTGKQEQGKREEEILALLISDEGPAAMLFSKFSEKYSAPKRGAGMPKTHRDGALHSWEIRPFDYDRAGVRCAIGLTRNRHEARFVLWRHIPSGIDAEAGYINIRVHVPVVEIISGREPPHRCSGIFLAKIRFPSTHEYKLDLKEESAFMRIVGEVLMVAEEHLENIVAQLRTS